MQKASVAGAWGHPAHIHQAFIFIHMKLDGRLIAPTLYEIARTRFHPSVGVDLSDWAYYEVIKYY